MKNNGSAKPVQFGLFERLHPITINFKEMSQYILKLLGLAELGQVVVIPYDPSFHWVLFTIDMVRYTVYYLDPSQSNSNEEMMQICPRQPSNFECGYYVMKYIQDIITNVNILKNNFKGIDEYTMEELSRLRDQWATYVVKLITTYNYEVCGNSFRNFDYVADALITISFYQRSILVRLCLCVNGDDKKMHAGHEAHVHVHTHATHGHAHGYAFESSDTSDSGTSNLFRR
ncbi:hypothetical protein WN943_022870 [Citrus x changshan-huyou]